MCRMAVKRSWRPGGGGRLRQGLGDGGEQQGYATGGGEEEVVQLGGDGEDDMKVRDGEEARGVDPARGLQALAFGAMPIPQELYAIS